MNTDITPFHPDFSVRVLAETRAVHVEIIGCGQATFFIREPSGDAREFGRLADMNAVFAK